MNREEFAWSVRSRLKTALLADQPATRGLLDGLVAEITADGDEYMAWGVEEHARPHYARWLKPAGRTAPKAGSLVSVAELPGGEL